MGVFDEFDQVQYSHRYNVQLEVTNLHGGVPTDPKIIEAWLRSKFGTSDQLVRDLVARTLDEIEGTLDEAGFEEAIAEVGRRKVNGFYRDNGELAIRGRHVKAALKEAANVLWPDRRWGPTRKGTRSFIAEHVFVLEDMIGLGAIEPDGIDQRQVVSRFGTSFAYEEFLTKAAPEFTIATDHEFTHEEWGRWWVVAQRLGSRCRQVTGVWNLHRHPMGEAMT